MKTADNSATATGGNSLFQGEEALCGDPREPETSRTEPAGSLPPHSLSMAPTG